MLFLEKVNKKKYRLLGVVPSTTPFILRDRAVAARRAHNSEVNGANPFPASLKQINMKYNDRRT